MRSVIRCGWRCSLIMALIFCGGCSLDIARAYAVSQVVRLASTVGGGVSTALLPALLRSLNINTEASDAT